MANKQTDWDASQRTGSRGIFVWESTNLIDWTGERLVVVEDETAGMVWAPEAIWDEDQGKLITELMPTRQSFFYFFLFRFHG